MSKPPKLHRIETERTRRDRDYRAHLCGGHLRRAMQRVAKAEDGEPTAIGIIVVHADGSMGTDWCASDWKDRQVLIAGTEHLRRRLVDED